jgi:hypothetical protein
MRQRFTIAELHPYVRASRTRVHSCKPGIAFGTDPPGVRMAVGGWRAEADSNQRDVTRRIAQSGFLTRYGP